MSGVQIGDIFEQELKYESELRQMIQDWEDENETDRS